VQGFAVGAFYLTIAKTILYEIVGISPNLFHSVFPIKRNMMIS
jgi:hypothetical protein